MTNNELLKAKMAASLRKKRRDFHSYHVCRSWVKPGRKNNDRTTLCDVKHKMEQKRAYQRKRLVKRERNLGVFHSLFVYVHTLKIRDQYAT